jgi:hypothetical protein
LTQASVLTRLREGDIRSVPLAVWPFLILALAYIFLTIENQFETLDLQGSLYLATGVAPLAFAIAVAWVTPIDRRFVIAATAIAVPTILRVAELLLVYQLNVVSNDGWNDLPLGTLRWASSLGGVLLLGIALGGIRTRLGWVVVALGAAWFVIHEFQVAIQMSSTSFPAEYQVPLEQLVIPFVYGLIFVGWTFVSGAALDHGLRAIALGAGILFAIVVYSDFILPHLISPESTNFTLLNLGGSLVSLLGWGALIYGALTEIPRAQLVAQRRAVGLT